MPLPLPLSPTCTLLLYTISLHRSSSTALASIFSILRGNILSSSTRLSQLTSYSWSPLHELVPNPPLRHGHAISIDMAYSATLSRKRNLLTEEDHMRLLRLFSRAGLSMDHPQFDAPMLDKATAAILRTRDGKLRLAVPISPIGECVFLNDVSHEEMSEVLEVHKKLVGQFPREGKGLDAFVDASDTGYNVHDASASATSGAEEKQAESNQTVPVSLRSQKPMDHQGRLGGDVAVRV